MIIIDVVIKLERFFLIFSAIVISLLVPDVKFGAYKLPVRIEVSKLAADRIIVTYV